MTDSTQHLIVRSPIVAAYLRMSGHIMLGMTPDPSSPRRNHFLFPTTAISDFNRLQLAITAMYDMVEDERARRAS